MNKHKTLFIILALGLVTRLAVIQQPLWYDEAYTAMLVQLPLNSMWAAIVGDVHPPTWYLIERAFSSVLGTSEVVLRLPSLLLGLLAIYLTWYVARHLNDMMGLVAAGIMAVAPFTVYYSVEARVYSLLMCATLVAIIGALERRPILLSLGTMLILMSHNTAAVYMPAIGLLAWNRMGFRRAATWIAIGMIPWLLWLPTMLNQASVMGTLGYWVADITGNKVVFLLTQMNDQVFPGFTPDWIIPVNVAVTSMLIIFPIAEAIRTRNGAAFVLAGITFLPMIIGVIISLVWQPVMIARAMSGSFPFWVMLVSWWITSPREWSMSQCALAGLASCLVLATTISMPHWDRSMGMYGAMDYLNQNSGPSDLICHADSSTNVLTRYYLHRQTAILNPGNLRYQMSDETMRAVGIRLADPSQCDWLIYVKSPLLDEEVIPAVNSVLRTNDAEVVYTILESRGALAQLWRLKHVDRTARARFD
jgi:hypothetical protein